MTTLEQVKTWNFLMAEVNKVPDNALRIAMKEDFRRKALRDWGWVPGETATNPDPDLNEWEKEFLMDIRDSIEFGVDARQDKHEEEIHETRTTMWFFVRTGGKLADIPANIRTPYIEELYYETLKQIGAEVLQQADNVIGNSE